MHTHILSTDKSEYIVVTDNENWDWEEFFNNTIPNCNIAKIITSITGDNGKREIREFSF
jgi:hypothetical protein